MASAMLADIFEMTSSEARTRHYGPLMRSWDTMPNLSIDSIEGQAHYEFAVRLILGAEFTSLRFTNMTIRMVAVHDLGGWRPE